VSRRVYNTLADGSYSFQVQALGTAGAAATAGPAASATFLVDTTPPVVSRLRFAPAAGALAAPMPSPSPSPNPEPSAAGGAKVVLASGAFTASFVVSDGVLGSGVNGCAQTLAWRIMGASCAVPETALLANETRDVV